MTVPWLTLLIFTPLSGSLFASRIVDPALARRFAIGLAIALACITVGIMASFDPTQAALQLTEVGPTLCGARYHLGIDGLSILLVPLVVLCGGALIVAGPKRELTPRAVAVVLATQAGTLGALVALDGPLLVVLSALSLAPIYWLLREGEAGPRRVYAVHAAMGVIVLIALILLVARTSSGSATPFELTPSVAGDPSPIPPYLQTLAFVLTAVAVLTRMGIPPFHAWLPSLLSDGPLVPAALVVSSNVGLYVLARLALWLTPAASASALPILADLALVGAVYTAIVALGQRDLLRAVGFVVVSEACLTLIGLASMNEQSVGGALLEGVSSGAASLGLLLTLGAVRARTGTLDTRRLGGLVRQMPRAAAAYFGFALAVVGFPGTLGFVGDDLLLHGVLHAHPVIALVLLLVVALNGIALLKGGVEAFFGGAREHATPRTASLADLLPRERGVAFLLACSLLATGLAPELLLRERAATIAVLVADDAPRGVTSGGRPPRVGSRAD